MPERLVVDAEISRGVVVLKVGYGLEQMLKDGAAKELSKRLLEEYQRKMNEEAQKTNDSARTGSCVVVITAETAGSPLVRALFELYKVVTAEGGQVICVGYPSDYIDSLTELGLPSLDGFSLATSQQAAIETLASA